MLEQDERESSRCKVSTKLQKGSRPKAHHADIKAVSHTTGTVLIYYSELQLGRDRVDPASGGESTKVPSFFWRGRKQRESNPQLPKTEYICDPSNLR